MKRLKRSVVILLCIATLLAIFGCKAKDKYILDGPGMVNPYAWDSFYVSRSGDSYAEHNFHITVTDSEKGYIVRGTLLNYEEEACILLPRSACEQIDALKPGQLPDAVRVAPEETDVESPFLLDAPQVSIGVSYVDGRQLSKVDQDDFSIEIYQIVAPYFEEKYNG